MCFCQLSGNSLSYVLKPEWTGSVEIHCAGTLKKRVEVDWGVPGQPTDEFDSCQGGSQGLLEKRNGTPVGLNVTVNVYYADDDCSGSAPSILPLDTSSQVSCNETPETQNAVFLFEVMGTGETVQVTIVNEEDQELPTP